MRNCCDLVFKLLLDIFNFCLYKQIFKINLKQKLVYFAFPVWFFKNISFKFF